LQCEPGTNQFVPKQDGTLPQSHEGFSATKAKVWQTKLATYGVEHSLRPTDFLGRRLENQFLAILTECSVRAPSDDPATDRDGKKRSKARPEHLAKLL
jgi:hypothetical protein